MPADVEQPALPDSLVLLLTEWEGLTPADIASVVQRAP
jgi:hypothetical protein